MNTKANYFKIGLFVISAVTIAIIAIIALGANIFSRESILAETYFDASVQGLDVGSPVKFRGVQIGKIEDISLASTEYQDNYHLVLIRMSLRSSNRLVAESEFAELALKKEIEKGLRVRMAFLGVTGTAYLEVDYIDPARNPPLEIHWTPRYSYIPSAPSTITRLSESVDKIMRKLEKVDLQGIEQSLNQSLKAITRTEDPLNQSLVAFRNASESMNNLTTKLEEVTRNFEKPLIKSINSFHETSSNMNKLTANLDPLPGEISESLTQFRKTTHRIETMVSSGQQDLEETLENIRIISENLKELTDNAKRYPAQLLFGEPPKQMEPGKP